MATIFSVVVIATLLAAVAQAGYVDLYREADFKFKLATMNDVFLDACYSFTYRRLENAKTSARWSETLA
ncbi:hypothetical protein GN958_ATG22734 [Phytophthora infestans]|uniref:Secreted RxLR effector peptide protein n=1 Tax=Phytophthora infestans TaxID=4787 RepID=A0A8S9TIZ2_PHYIN|nr:hypothetical protein GN958_ATG22734 [Phytophthora infestans]